MRFPERSMPRTTRPAVVAGPNGVVMRASAEVRTSVIRLPATFVFDMRPTTRFRQKKRPAKAGLFSKEKEES
jgi:hypothetical protein